MNNEIIETFLGRTVYKRKIMQISLFQGSLDNYKTIFLAFESYYEFRKYISIPIYVKIISQRHIFLAFH